MSYEPTHEELVAALRTARAERREAQRALGELRSRYRRTSRRATNWRRFAKELQAQLDSLKPQPNQEAPHHEH